MHGPLDNAAGYQVHFAGAILEGHAVFTVIAFDQLPNVTVERSSTCFRNRCDCGKDVTVYVDPDRIQQVMANLLEHALRHTPVGGSVNVACECIDGSATITVADTGDGIPGDRLEAIFDRFHRGDTSRGKGGEGSGLGLTIARGIITDHGGTLTATSAGHGHGCELHIIVPTSSTDIAQARAY